MDEEMKLSKAQEVLGYVFKNINLLKTAFTHTSYAYEHKVKSNERLEYLGDSILEFISSEYLFKNYPKLNEGEMTKVRAYSVCENSLFSVATKLGFSDFLYLGRSEKSAHSVKKAIMADSVEAVIAAIYIDSNDIEIVRKFIINNFSETIEYASKNVGSKDYKTVLQEKLQEHGEVKITYRITNEKGPDHAKTFTAEVDCDGRILASGQGLSKKKAEMEAARKALEEINN